MFLSTINGRVIGADVFESKSFKAPFFAVDRMRSIWIEVDLYSMGKWGYVVVSMHIS